MTHSQLIKRIAKTIDLKPEEVAILWQEVNHILVKELVNQEKIRIKNFGAFVVVRHKSRTVPDPREMTKKIVIFDQLLPKFRPSEQLRRSVKEVIPTATLPEDEPEAELNSKLNTEHTIEPEKEVEIQPKVTALAPEKIVTPKGKAKKPASHDPDSSFRSRLPKAVNIGYIDLNDLTIDKDILSLIPYHIAEKYQMVAVKQKNNSLTVAMTDPGDREAIEIVSRQTGLDIVPKITTAGELKHALDQYSSNGELSELGELTDDTNPDEETSQDVATNDTRATEEGLEQEDAPAAKVVTGLLERAVREKASDVHIEPEEKKVVVRFRIDGLLNQVLELPKNLHSSVVSRLKILSNLKIDESRLPQDGRLRMTIDRNTVDFRLSTLPTVNGEKIVMRILDKSSGILSFEDLGLNGINFKRVNDNITKSHGMVLVTGPTGSGKTTTLYAVLGKLMDPKVNIITVEDPVEYRIQGINQSQVNPQIGYDFASGLRSIVRQDPDIILIGEIRDLETATMAIHSALTGHVVLSTLHTNDAAGALPRLIDMGIEPFLITSSTNAVVAQRLVRKICKECKVKVKLPEESLTEVRKELELLSGNKHAHLEKIDLDRLVFYKGKGCSHCHSSGYIGRLGIFETLSITESIKEMALKRVSASELTAQAIKEGMITLKQDGILKALAGITTLEEVWRVTKD